VLDYNPYIIIWLTQDPGWQAALKHQQL